MTDIPQTADEFALFVADNAGQWPSDLREKGVAAALTLNSLDQANAAKSPAFMEASRKDLQAFAEAYTAWRTGRH